VGFIYFLAPVAALYLVFMPIDGMGLFGLNGGPGIMVHAFIANAPYGIVTTLAVAALCGRGGPGVSSHGRQDLPEDLRDPTPDLRVVVCAGSDPDRQIEFRHDKEPLPAVAEADLRHCRGKKLSQRLTLSV